MCENLMKLEGNIFIEEFLEDLEHLANDKVPNVRLLLFKTINNHFLN